MTLNRKNRKGMKLIINNKRVTNLIKALFILYGMNTTSKLQLTKVCFLNSK